MKKSIIMILAVITLLGFSCTVFAAPNSFEDVPAGHWAYQSIAQLAKDGLIEGYSDGMYRGSKTVSRYEMAVIVANALTKEDRASAASKAELARLKTEFGSELELLGERMTKVENRLDKAEKMQFKIVAREIWAHANNAQKNNNPTDQYYLYRFFMTTNLDPNAQFITMYQTAEDINSNAYTTSQGSNFVINQAYLRAKSGATVFNIGRQPFSWLGNGLVCDNAGRWDGATFEVGNPQKGFWIRTGAAQRWLGTVSAGTPTYAGGTVLNPVNITGGTRSFFMYNAKYTVDPNLNFISVYLKDNGTRSDGNSLYDSLSLGFNYKLNPKWTLSSEYAKNRADLAKEANQNKAPEGMYTQVKYNNLNVTKIGSWDIFSDYRKAGQGFDLGGLTTLDNLKNWGLISAANDVKGLDLVYEYVPYKNVVASLRGYNLKGYSNNNRYKGYILRLDYNY